MGVAIAMIVAILLFIIGILVGVTLVLEFATADPEKFNNFVENYRKKLALNKQKDYNASDESN